MYDTRPTFSRTGNIKIAVVCASYVRSLQSLPEIFKIYTCNSDIIFHLLYRRFIMIYIITFYIIRYN